MAGPARSGDGARESEQWTATREAVADHRGAGEQWDAVNLGLIPARGGSRGVPGKNLRLLDGIPLIAHSILSARESGIFERVYVSTEDPEVRDAASAYGACVIARPAEIARDETPMPAVVEHAISWYERHEGALPENTFLLQPTSPLRSAQDIRTAALILAEESCSSVMGVFEADDPPQWGLTAGHDGLLRPAGAREEYLARRQDLARTYFDGPVHAARTTALLAEQSFLTRRTRFFVVPRTRAVDIDTEMDFLFAEFLLQHARRAGS